MSSRRKSVSGLSPKHDSESSHPSGDDEPLPLPKRISALDSSESISEGASTMVPTFKGYLLVRTSDYLSRWRTKFFVLVGNTLNRLATSDSSAPTQTIKLQDAEIKTNEKKFEFRIKTPRRKIEIRARDKHDFECWSLVLHRAAAWKGALKTDTFLNVAENGSIEAMDLDLEASEEDDILDFIDNEQEFERMRDQKREEVFRKLIELKSLFDKLSTQPPFASDEHDHKKKKQQETEPQRFLHVSREVLNLSAYFIGVLENERDTWKNKCKVAELERAQIEESLKLLARQHQRLEKKASSAMHKTEIPDGHNGIPFEGEVIEESLEGPEEDSDEEFFDAIDSGPSFVMPTQTENFMSRKFSTNDFVRRTRLPAYGPEKRPGVWAVLKNNIGKDFSRISIPIQFNEPLSALQKWAEDLEYADMLDVAIKITNPLERLGHVAAFHCSHYSDTMHRLYKPFNPILGETYEVSRMEIGDGFRYASEQVSHHPPVSACYSVGNSGWEYYTTLEVKNAFKGKDMEVYPQGTSHIKFPNGDHITYKRATTCVRNIIVGKMWVDNYGEVKMVNHRTGDYCVLNFKPYSYFSGTVAEVSGTVYDKDGKPHFHLVGKWTEGMTIQPADESSPPKLIWKRADLPINASKQFEFTSFAITLNEMDPGLEKKLPPTDSRFRQDLRLYEQGKVEQAQAEKERLEEKQRSARRLLEARGVEHTPLFFSKQVDPDLQQTNWTFNSEYWRRREKFDWSTSPDLFRK